MRSRALVKILPIAAVAVAGWFAWSWWWNSPDQVATRISVAFLNGQYASLYHAGLQTELEQPSYNANDYVNLMSAGAFPMARLYRVDPVLPAGSNVKGFRISDSQGRQFSLNLVRTPGGWRLDDLGFLFVNLPKDDGRMDKLSEIARIMDQLGVASLYHPEVRSERTAGDLRTGKGWAAATRRKFKWE